MVSTSTISKYFFDGVRFQYFLILLWWCPLPAFLNPCLMVSTSSMSKYIIDGVHFQCFYILVWWCPLPVFRNPCLMVFAPVFLNTSLMVSASNILLCLQLHFSPNVLMFSWWGNSVTSVVSLFSTFHYQQGTYFNAKFHYLYIPTVCIKFSWCFFFGNYPNFIHKH